MCRVRPRGGGGHACSARCTPRSKSRRAHGLCLGARVLCGQHARRTAQRLQGSLPACCHRHGVRPQASAVRQHMCAVTPLPCSTDAPGSRPPRPRRPRRAPAPPAPPPRPPGARPGRPAPPPAAGAPRPPAAPPPAARRARRQARRLARECQHHRAREPSLASRTTLPPAARASEGRYAAIGP